MKHRIFCDCWECQIRGYEKVIRHYEEEIEIRKARIQKIRQENVPG